MGFVTGELHCEHSLACSVYAAVSLAAVPEAAVLGVEGPLWSEHLRGPADIDFMAFPRIPAIAEPAWSPHRTFVSVTGRFPMS